jgi:glycerol-3-phosphate O-acyltransferase/dihydroxyacetone phosphate acyltransferase
MRVIRAEAHRRVAFLIAAKSMDRKFIGTASSMVGAVPVGRALDSTKKMVRGVGTNFEAKGFQVGGLLVLPKVKGVAANAEILEIVGPEEIRLKKPFKNSTAVNQMTGRERVVVDGATEDDHAKEFKGTSFEVAPKVDQTKVYDAVFEKLNSGGCVGIFPEGGSHDRTELLPLKGGFTG